MLQKTKKHSMIWEMCVFVTMESAVFMRKEFLEKMFFHRENKRPQTKTNVRHIYRICFEQNEIFGLETIGC